MTQAELIIALKSVGCLAFLWFFIFFLWKDYCVDNFRERIFTLRDEFFLVAARGEIPFDHPAYRMLRARLNVALRYAHQFTLSKFLLALALPSLDSAEAVALRESILALPEETQATVNRYRTMFVLNVLRFMILRSFFLAIFASLSKTGVTAIAAFNDLVKRFILPKASEGIERIESEALEEDKLHTHSVPVGA